MSCLNALFSIFVVCASGSKIFANAGCTFDQRDGHPALSILKKLEGTRYSCEDEKSTEKYHYDVGICTAAIPGLGSKDQQDFDHAGVVQIKHAGKEDESKVIVGLFNDADFIKGTDWILLMYSNGKPYSDYHCGGGGRMAHIMIACDKGNTKGTLDIVEENTAKNESCYYLFELKHDAVCPEEKYTLSAGSIICIVFFSVAAVYLIVGVIVQRAVRGAQGWEQIPNYTFWKAIGNYAADGCDLVFRSRDSSSREYRGVSGENNFNQEIPRQSDEPDDHLLSM